MVWPLAINRIVRIGTILLSASIRASAPAPSGPQQTKVSRPAAWIGVSRAGAARSAAQLCSSASTAIPCRLTSGPEPRVAGPDVSLRVRNTNLLLTLQVARWPGELEALATGTAELCCGAYTEGSGRQTHVLAGIQMSKS